MHDNSFDAPISEENTFKIKGGGNELGPVFKLAFEKLN